jgi:hypothetical protein
MISSITLYGSVFHGALLTPSDLIMCVPHS